VRIDLADDLPALGVVVLDEADRAGERALVAFEQALGEGSLGRHGLAIVAGSPAWAA
jgi:hypothetical protein